ncbi:MAG: hypothetical protein IT582_10480 [Opitutaceae bacterium]|nr:hypothetical protein [Opitutaceae bacterium]
MILPARPASATLIIPPQFEEMAAKSDFVVRGRVTDMTSELVAKGEGRKIFTRVKIEVLEIIAGAPPTELVLVCLGGRVGDEELRVDGSPEFQVGQEGIYFVRHNGRALSPLFAMGYGLYPIATDAATKRRYVTRGDTVPLESTAEVARPLLGREVAELERLRRSPVNALSPDEFSTQIKTARRAYQATDAND